MSTDSSAKHGPIDDKCHPHRDLENDFRAGCLLLLGIECEKTYDYETAAHFYHLGIECGPTEIETRYFLHNNLGYCLNRIRLYDEAERMCLAAIGIDPRRYNAYKNLGLALQGQGIYSEAAALFLKAASLYPPDPRSIEHLEEILADHREEVGREIPDIAEHLAAAIHARIKLMQ